MDTNFALELSAQNGGSRKRLNAWFDIKLTHFR